MTTGPIFDDPPVLAASGDGPALVADLTTPRDEEEDGLFPPPAPAPPQTGDAVVDRLMADLHGALSRDLDHQIDTANAVGEALAQRLQDLDSE